MVACGSGDAVDSAGEGRLFGEGSAAWKASVGREACVDDLRLRSSFSAAPPRRRRELTPYGVSQIIDCVQIQLSAAIQRPARRARTNSSRMYGTLAKFAP